MPDDETGVVRPENADRIATLRALHDDHRLGAVCSVILALEIREARAHAPHVPLSVDTLRRIGEQVEPVAPTTACEWCGDAVAAGPAGLVKGSRRWCRLDCYRSWRLTTQTA